MDFALYAWDRQTETFLALSSVPSPNSPDWLVQGETIPPLQGGLMGHEQQKMIQSQLKVIPKHHIMVH